MKSININFIIAYITYIKKIRIGNIHVKQKRDVDPPPKKNKNEGGG